MRAMIGAVSEPAEPRVTVCLPTYNERENLRPMIAALRRVLPESARILVIDDASPDGTGKLADEFAETDPRVSVLHRERKEGLGPAYIAGFERALADGAELIVEIDCDFSHDPNDVPRLLAAVEDADVGLGSRYVAGSAVRDWGRGRRFISKAGSAYARIVLGTKVHDPTGGFKCFRRRVLETIPLDRISSRGYAFQIEMTYRAERAGFRVVEVPITFADREVGHSKMSRAIIFEAIWRVPSLRLRALFGRL
jgi:dolichol-phosphate mannosyltransferase